MERDREDEDGPTPSAAWEAASTVDYPMVRQLLRHGVVDENNSKSMAAAVAKLVETRGYCNG